MSSREYGQDVEIDLGRKNNSRKKEVITSKRPSRVRGTEAIAGKCKICGSNSWDTDTVRGETICSECGFVAAENMIDPGACLLYTSPSPRDYAASRMPSSA